MDSQQGRCRGSLVLPERGDRSHLTTDHREQTTNDAPKHRFFASPIYAETRSRQQRPYRVLMRLDDGRIPDQDRNPTFIIFLDLSQFKLPKKITSAILGGGGYPRGAFL